MSNNIDKDIEKLEENIDIHSLIFGNGNAELSEKVRNALSNVLNKLKSYQEREKENEETIDTLQNELNSSNQGLAIKGKMIEIINKKIKEVDYRIKKTMITERDLQFNLGKKCVLTEIIEEYRKEAEKNDSSSSNEN